MGKKESMTETRWLTHLTEAIATPASTVLRGRPASVAEDSVRVALPGLPDKFWGAGCRRRAARDCQTCCQRKCQRTHRIRGKTG